MLLALTACGVLYPAVKHKRRQFLCNSQSPRSRAGQFYSRLWDCSIMSTGDGETSEPRACVVCRMPYQSNATFICSTCFAPLCKDHAVFHVSSSVGTHSINLLARRQGTESLDAESERRAGGIGGESFAVCPLHDEVKSLYCVQCSVAVCEHCAVIGEHAQHSPVMETCDLVARRAAEARQTVQRLQGPVTEDVQHLLQALENGKAQVISRAVLARHEMAIAGDRLHDIVRSCVQQNVVAVDAIERAHLGEIRDKQERLQQQISGIDRMANFFSRVLEQSQGAHAMDLFDAFNKRATSLMSVEDVADLPIRAGLVIQHSSSVETLRDAALAAISSYIGVVKNCEE